jgi:hypothetical protein
MFRGVPWLTGRPLAAALIQRILRVEAPAIIDGQTQLEKFADSGEAGRTLKTDFDAGVFTSADLFCFDPALDLAQAAVSSGDQRTGEQLRRKYELATGGLLDPERWLLYQLLAITEIETDGLIAESQVAHRVALLLQCYYGEVLLGGLTAPASGPLCAVELDGALETTTLGFPATTPLGAMALRSLLCHGFRPLLATGRSPAELRDRCLAYGAAGGVAEHGAVTYDRQRDSFSHLIADEKRGALHYSPHLAAPVVDTGTALRSLADEVGGACRGEKPLAFAVSGAGTDRSILSVARAAFAPASTNLGGGLSAAELLDEPCQRGLAAAVARVLGHPAGACEVCALPRLTAQTRMFLKLLGVQDAAGLSKLGRALALLPSAFPGREYPIRRTAKSSSAWCG